MPPTGRPVTRRTATPARRAAIPGDSGIVAGGGSCGHDDRADGSGAAAGHVLAPAGSRTSLTAVPASRVRRADVLARGVPGPGPEHRPGMGHAAPGPAARTRRRRDAPPAGRRAPAGRADGDPLPGAGAPHGAVRACPPARADRPALPAGLAAIGALIRVDLHLHSRYSPDSATSLEALVARAGELGLGRIALTDHNTAEGALALERLAPDLAIVGEEVKTSEGEIIG
ncbi:MAG: PHP domain-containing protein, partial [Chloroflexi bacterium]